MTFTTFPVSLLGFAESPAGCEARGAAELALDAAGFEGVFFLRKKFLIFGVFNADRLRGMTIELLG